MYWGFSTGWMSEMLDDMAAQSDKAAHSLCASRRVFGCGRALHSAREWERVLDVVLSHRRAGLIAFRGDMLHSNGRGQAMGNLLRRIAFEFASSERIRADEPTSPGSLLGLLAVPGALTSIAIRCDSFVDYLKTITIPTSMAYKTAAARRLGFPIGQLKGKGNYNGICSAIGDTRSAAIT